MTLIKNINKALLLTVMSSLLSCGGGGSSGTSSAETSVIGSWNTGCIVDTDPNVYESIVKFNITSTTIEIISEYYGHAANNCNTISEINRHIHPYTTSGNRFMMSGGTLIDFTFHDPTDITDINVANLCQFNNWQLGVSKSVLGQTCSALYDFSANDQITFAASGNTITLTDSSNNTVTATK